MITKVLLVIISILILLSLILFIIIRNKDLKYKQLEEEFEVCETINDELSESFSKLQEEIEIEKKHNKQLVKKISDISNMSIDDVLHQLQVD